jgi:aspartate 1-decarboxylase
MSIPIFDHPPPFGFFQAARQHLLQTYAIAQPPSHKTAPRVTYIDRQNTTRRMSNQTHEAFLQVMLNMQGSGQIDFRHMRLEEYAPVAQVEVVAWSDVTSRAE